MARERFPRILQCAVTFHGYLHSLREERAKRGTRMEGLRNERRRFAPPGRITQLRSFPSELFLQFYARRLGEGGGGLAPLPVILLRNSDNATAAMNNGGITRRKSANIFFRAAPKPKLKPKPPAPVGTFESPYRSLFDFPPLSDSTL